MKTIKSLLATLFVTIVLLVAPSSTRAQTEAELNAIMTNVATQVTQQCAEEEAYDKAVWNEAAKALDIYYNTDYLQRLAQTDIAAMDANAIKTIIISQLEQADPTEITSMQQILSTLQQLGANFRIVIQTSDSPIVIPITAEDLKR